jgi:ribose transport system substrate-binding protein
MAFAGCERKVETPQSRPGAASAKGEKRNVVIGFVGKSLANDVFRVAEVGARDAVKELGDKYNANITLEVRTPSEEDATRQAEAIDALARMGADAVIVSASEANTLKNAIDRAVDRGTIVLTFDSDVPNSKRFAYYGCDDATSGARLMDLLAKSMGEKGTIAILAGNESAPNLQKRVKGVKDELAKYPNMKLLQPNGVFYHQETPEKAAEAVANAMNANPSIEGWAMIGGWPLFTTNALRWQPGSPWRRARPQDLRAPGLAPSGFLRVAAHVAPIARIRDEGGRAGRYFMAIPCGRAGCSKAVSKSSSKRESRVRLSCVTWITRTS